MKVLVTLALKAIIGLGNPGTQYVGTRHNVGFQVIEDLVHQASSSLQSSPKRGSRGHSAPWQEKFGCKFLRENIAQISCLLVLPQKFMNLSGETVVPLLRFFKIDAPDTVVIHDDLDLAPGIIRIKRGGSSGGHRGVEDIIQHLGSPDFLRIRIGIGHPHRKLSNDSDSAQRTLATKEQRESEVSSWVLNVPRGDEKKILQKGIANACEALKMLLQEGLEATQGRFHRT